MVTRLTGGLTPGDGADPRTFPAIWNATAETIETQGSAITSAESDITVLQGSAVALGSAVDVIEAWNIDDLNDVSFGTVVPADGNVLTYSAGSGVWTAGTATGGGGASVTIGTAAPGTPTDGDMWWNSTDGNLYLYYTDADSSQWVAANGPQVLVSETAPNGYQGQLWFDSTQGKVFIYYDDGSSGQFVSAIGGSLAGSVLQVVSTTKTDTQSSSLTAGNSVAVTGLTASITPSSTSNKVLVTATVTVGHSTFDRAAGLSITRGGSVISGAIGDTSGSRSSVTGQSNAVPNTSASASVTVQFLDSPASTSSLTYGVDLDNTDSSTRTLYVNRGAEDSDTARGGRSVSTITVMEIAG